MECSFCGILSEKANYFDVLSHSEIVKICEQCLKMENLPIVKRPTQKQIEKSKVMTPYYKRVQDSKKSYEDRKILRDKTHSELRKMVNQNYEKNVMGEKKKYPDLAENFNWLIFNARRNKRVMREQMAMRIGVPESAMRLAEQGILPDNYKELIKKIESFLGINLSRGTNEAKTNYRTPRTYNQKNFVVNKDSMREMKLSDVKSLKENEVADEIADFEKN